jgi:electron transfer flavoprotein alpha subunit
VTAAETLRVAAVLDATGSAAERHARALGGFLAAGLALTDGVESRTVTHVFGTGDAGDPSVRLAPTREVRLVRVPPHRPDIIAAALVAFQSGGGADLYLFPSGPSGSELAARLAARSGGSLLTGVLSADFSGGRLTCRRAVYAGHLTGAFEPGPRPWCIVLDAGWADAHGEPPEEHVIEAAAELPAGNASPGVVPAPAPLLEIEPLEAPPTGDLETASLLVVAGRGAGSRGGVERIAAAAARMGAAFGVTRPVVMNAWAGPDRQIGASGTRTAPAVCLVAGASGAPAFMWGVERAAFIAAIDTDDHAPIAGECDAFVTGDAVAVLEALGDLIADGGTGVEEA